MNLHAQGEAADQILLQYLLDPGTKAELAMQAVKLGVDAVFKAVEWVDTSSDKFAEVDSINKIVKIIDTNRGNMVEMAEK